MKNSNFKEIFLVTAFGLLLSTTSGCWLVAAGAGGEAGYVGAQETRTAGETLTDQRITADIKAKLLADASTPGFDINVDTFKGSVTLKGVLHDTTQIDNAIRIAGNTDGVKHVESKLYVE